MLSTQAKSPNYLTTEKNKPASKFTSQFYVFQDVLKTWLEDALKTLWTQTKYIVGISVSNKSKCVSNKFIFHKSIFDNSNANPKCIH